MEKECEKPYYFTPTKYVNTYTLFNLYKEIIWAYLDGDLEINILFKYMTVQIIKMKLRNDTCHAC